MRPACQCHGRLYPLVFFTVKPIQVIPFRVQVRRDEHMTVNTGPDAVDYQAEVSKFSAPAFLDKVPFDNRRLPFASDSGQYVFIWPARLE